MPPAPAADWPSVLRHARRIVDEHGGNITRPALWAALVAADAAPPHAEHGFRGALRAAQQRDNFPKLPRAKPGPAPGSEQCGGTERTGRLELRTHTSTGLAWWYAICHRDGVRIEERLGRADAHYGLTREEAEEFLRELVHTPTPHEIRTERLDACLNLLKSVAGIKTIRLSPSVFRVLADQGYGEDIVMHAARLLVSYGLVEMHYEMSGLDAWPVVECAAG